MKTNKIDDLFAKKKGRILSIYFTAGFPHLGDTVSIMQAIEDSGADMIEIGMPFSDPLADGPVIQDSSMKALKNGMSIPKLFDQLSEVRKKVHLPLILMGYLNPVMQYGETRFFHDAASLGIDGLILPDLPLRQYVQEYKSSAEGLGLHTIFLITPQTSEQRVREIDRETEGFIYMVSSASTTGTKDGTSASQFDYFERIQQMNLQNPRLIGFGIKDKKSFDTACRYADGAIIGTAFIQALSGSSDPAKASFQFIRSILAS